MEYNSDIFAGFALFAMIFYGIIILVWLGACVGFGVIAYHMAKSRGFNPVPAFFAGFFTFVTLFIIAMFPKKAPAARQAAVPAARDGQPPTA